MEACLHIQGEGCAHIDTVYAPECRVWRCEMPLAEETLRVGSKGGMRLRATPAGPELTVPDAKRNTPRH